MRGGGGRPAIDAAPPGCGKESVRRGDRAPATRDGGLEAEFHPGRRCESQRGIIFGRAELPGKRPVAGAPGGLLSVEST